MISENPGQLLFQDLVANANPVKGACRLFVALDYNSLRHTTCRDGPMWAKDPMWACAPPPSRTRPGRARLLSLRVSGLHVDDPP